MQQVEQADAARAGVRPPAPLTDALVRGLHRGGAELTRLGGLEPADERDQLLTLLALYDLNTAPLPVVGDAARHQWHPALAELKARLETRWIAALEATPVPDSIAAREAPAAIRAVAGRDRVPLVYHWLASEATWEEVVWFLAVEGGPDAGFDDLVAACQLGLRGRPKLELASNYWDELGNGRMEDIHTALHDRLVEAVAMPRLDRRDLPVAALERGALGGLLATNRWLQPEMLGALGLLESQAGPRCRMVVRAFERLHAPADAYPFYVVHAEVDPIHGKNWLDNAIAPLAVEQPEWAPRMVRGAWWRSQVSAGFFQELWAQVSARRAAAVDR
ncbi:MAG: iron-containing redox enzyme family protein [Acidimicrobiales bacterium]